MKPKEIIPRFDGFLSSRNIAFEAVLVGGAALAILGFITCETRDCDILEPDIPEAVFEASREFALSLRAEGEILREDWLNNGPSQLVSILPDGWRSRLQKIYSGAVLTLWVLGMKELLLTKLFALCDRGLDLGDCLAMQPEPSELAAAEDWIVRQDANPQWPRHVSTTLADLGRRCGHGL